MHAERRLFHRPELSPDYGTVNIAADAPAQLTNQATVSGGGSAPVTASDPTTIYSYAEITSPPPGSILTPSAVTFTWTAGAGATAYWLDVGPSPGEGRYFGQNVGTALGQTVIGGWSIGQPVYVRLWTQMGDQWRYRDYTYKTGQPHKGAMISPSPGTTLSGSSVTFTWEELVLMHIGWMSMLPA